MEGVYEEIGWVRCLEMLGEGFNSMSVGGTVDTSEWGHVLVKAMTRHGESELERWPWKPRGEKCQTWYNESAGLAHLTCE